MAFVLEVYNSVFFCKLTENQELSRLSVVLITCFIGSVGLACFIQLF